MNLVLEHLIMAVTQPGSAHGRPSPGCGTGLAGRRL